MGAGLLVYRHDASDCTFLGFRSVFPLSQEYSSFEKAVNDIQPTLASPAVIAEIIKQECLEKDPGPLLFCGWENYCLTYRFRAGRGLRLRYQVEFVSIHG